MRAIAYMLALEMGLPNVVRAQDCCVTPVTPIAELRADSATWLGRAVSVRAVVSADFSSPDGLGGFFIQTPDAERVKRPDVSEGLFVRLQNGQAPSQLKAGDLICLSGRLQSRTGRLALFGDTRPTRCGQGKPVTPSNLVLPVDRPERFSSLEDMRVRLPQTLTITDVHELGSHGSVLLSHERLWSPTQDVAPAQARASSEHNALDRIVLDDGLGTANPDLRAQGSLPLWRAGQRVGPLDGILEMRHGAWRIQPLPGKPPVLEPSGNPRPPPPSRPAQTDLRVVAFNVDNYFNGDDAGGGFPATERRGARDPQAFARQETKLLASLNALQPDVIGLMEIANNGFGPHGAIARLARQLGPHWRVVDPGTPRLGNDAIMVALLYDSRRVTPVGAPASTHLDGAPRPPLAQRFRRPTGQASVMVVVNHLKSRLCKHAAGIEQDSQHQGCWNAARTRSAHALVTWLAGLPGAPGSPGNSEDKLLIGDLNSYAAEAPLRELAAAGYQNLVARLAGPAPYSFVYEGTAGYIDHVLAQPALAQHIKAVNIWHINADEPAARQYDATGTGGTRYAPDPYRSSDHDPVVIDLALDRR